MINFKNSILIVSHPDDECLFASSLLNKIATLVICFNNIPNEKKISNGRKKALKNYPLKNIKVINLNIDQSIESFRPINWSKIIDKESGIKGGYKDISYDTNYKKLLFKLRNIIKKNSILFTHNPWGEYGHAEHCQVFKACFMISKETSSNLYVTGYVSQLSKSYAIAKSHLLSSRLYELKTNSKVYNLLREHYIKYCCWTWSNSYILPRLECFYKVNLSYDSKSISIKNKSLNLPLIFIEFYNPFNYLIRKTIKKFLPSFLKKIIKKNEIF